MSADLPMAPLVPPTVEPTTAPAAVHFLAPRELVVLDGTLPEVNTLGEAIAADRPDADLLVLDPSRDALDQIGERLANGAPVSAIHLVAHGQAGHVVIRGAVIDASELARRTAQLQTWNLADHADILLYGCNVADGANGEAFVRMLAGLTGADVAASTDLTGSADCGGDWTLEFVTGAIDTATIAGPRLKGRWHGTLEATLVPTGAAESPPPSFSTPLAFERNAGQTDAAVDFLARGSGYTVFLDDGNAVIDVRHDDGTGNVVRLSLEGAQTPSASMGRTLLSGTSHYLIGDVSNWHRDVEQYGSVRFDEVYDGIDVQYYGAGRRLEYDFLVDAGTDTDVIGLRIEGAVAVEIADSGELVLTLDGTGRTMTFHAPVSYQRAADGNREHVDSRYVLRADGTVGFELGDHDRTRDLVIDPILGYATYLGGTGLETIEGVETDASGNVYVTGRTGSAAFPTSVGAYDTALGGSTDAFVTKFDSSGALQYSTYFGGSGNEWAYNLTVDGSGQVHVVGETSSSDLAIVNGADSSYGGSNDGFLVKLNAAGSAILYSTYYGGANADYLGAVHLGSGSTVYVAGGTTASTWDGYAGAINTGASGAGSLTWSQTYAAAGTEKLYDMDVDSTGDIWLVGETSTSGLTTGGPYDSTYNGGADVFLVRMSAAGGVEYVTYYGGTGNDYGNAIVAAADNTLYITGVSYSTSGIASTGAYDTTGDGTNGNAFLVRLDPSQSGSAQRLFGTYYGTSGASAAYEVAIDAEGGVVIVGQTSGTIPTTTTARDTTLSGSSDGFVAVFAANGSALRYGSHVGGSGTESANAAALDASGRLYVVGQTASTTLHTSGAYDTTGDATNGDGFIAQFLPLGSAARTTTDGGLSINTDGGNDAYLVADDGGAVLGGRSALTLEFDFATGTNASADNTLLSYAVTGQSNEVTVNIESTGIIELDIEFVTVQTSSAYAQLLDGNRHQVAITWDQSTGDGAFYVDGVLVESFSGFKTGATINGGGNLIFGQEQDSLGGGFNTAQRFSGTLYDVRVFGAVRTAEEIAGARLIRLSDDTPDLVANWRFDDWHGDGTTTEAVSGNTLTLGHASGTGFTPSQPTLSLGIRESSDTGTVVGSITALSDDRQARIDTLLAADATLTYNAQTDKFYKLGTSYVTWTSALSTATSTTLNGIAGQLVTVRSAAENAVVSAITGGNAVWLGAADATVEGTWRWYDGTTPADQFWQGTASGYRIDGAYTNWNAGEPSDTGGEDRLYQQADGTWNDAPDAMTSWTLIEWDADEVLDASQAITYSITTQTVTGAFAIDSDSGVLTVADGSLLDYETQTSHSITVRVTEGSLTYDRVYTVALSNLTLEADAGAPASASTAEDTARTFSSAGGNAVTVSDGTASDTRMQVSLSVSHGVLTLSQTTGLTLVSGANASAAMVLDGTESALNAALNGMTYTPNANHAGSDTLSVTTSVSADLTARYTFESASAADQAAGTAQNGTFVGNATAVADAERGDVLSLDGNGDAVQIAGLFGAPTNVTLAAWVRLNAPDSIGGDVISLGDSVILRVDDSNRGVSGIFYDGSNWEITESGVYLAGTGWHHVAYTVDDTGNVQRLYVNGELAAETGVSNAIAYSLGLDTYIGAHANGSADYDFNGRIDDARIYTRALSADEIAALAAETPASDASDVALTVTAVNDTPENLYFIPGLEEADLIGAYTFSAQNDLGRDDAGADAAMTLYGSPTQAAGASGGGALDLAGSASGQYGDIAGITTGGAMTIAAQVRFDSTGGWQRIVDFGQANSTGITAIYVGRSGTTSDLTFTLEKDLGGGNYAVYRATAAGAIVNGTWMHFAATVDGSGAMALYVNGVLADTEVGIVPEVGVRTNNYVGRSNWVGDALFDGAIDNLVVANGALSATEVAALYQQSNAVTIADNAADGTVLGTLVVADPDSPDTHTFNLTDSASGRFAIAADGTLTVGTGALLEHASATSHTLTARATDAGSLTRDESFTVSLTAVNEAPSFVSLDGTPTHTEGGAVIVLDADAQITDPELSAAGAFSGATLSLARTGGADGDDALAFDGTNVTVGGANVLVGGTQVGTYVFTGGEMVVTFGANATQSRVNTLLRNIVYWNLSDTPPATVQIDWTFDDGNTGAQGSGGALQVTGSTTVTITAVNDGPTAATGGPYTIAEGATLVLDASGSTDADGDALTYAWDLDNDGLYGETGEPTTSGPSVSWTTLQSLGIDDDGVHTIGLRVGDGTVNVTTTTTVTVTNVVPTVSVSGAASVAAGQAYTLTVSATDPGDDTITGWTVNWGDGTVSTYAGAPTSVTHTYLQGGFSRGITVSVTDEDGTWTPSDLLLSSYTTDRVLRLDGDTGALAATLPASASLDGPSALAIGPDGYLYVASAANDRVVRYDLANNTLIDTFVSAGSGGLDFPTALAFGPDGALYVASYNTNQILRHDGSTGAFQGVFAALDSPNALVWGPDGYLYAGSWFTGEIWRYDIAGNAVGGAALATMSGGFGVSSLAFGSDGFLYVGDGNASDLLKLHPTTGAVVSTLDPTLTAHGITFGPDGSLYASDFSGQSVERFRLDTGASLGRFDDGATGVGGPWGLVFSPSQVVSVTAGTAGVTVSAISGNTTEAGGTATFTVVLDAQPTADVTIPVTSTDTTEGTVSTSLLTFTSANWNVAQTVTVTGVDDALDDGDVAFSIVTGAASSADLNYDGLAVADVAVTNTDDDTPPVNTVPATATPVEDAPFAFTGAETISIADPDGNLTTVSASVGFGSLALTLSGGATISAGALNSAAFTLSGSLASLNASLASLTYTPDADFDGTDTLTLVSTDSTALTDTDTVVLTVSPVDDAPVLTGLTLLVSQGGGTTLSTADFTIADPDGPGGPRAVDVRNVTEGVFELVTAPGIPVTSFAFADVAAGLVRFVHSGAGAAPSFEASVRDSLAPGTFVPAAVGFTPTPIITTPGPPPEQAYSVVLTPTTPTSETPREPATPVRPADPVTTGTSSQTTDAAQSADARGERGPGAIDPRILMQMAVPRTPAPGPGEPAGGDEAGRGAAGTGVIGGGSGVAVSAPTAAPVASSGAPVGAQVPTVEAVTPDVAASGQSAPGPLTVALPGDSPASGPENRSAEEQQFDIMVNGVRLTGVSLSVGVVTWALRAGGIVSSLLASLPAWRFVDPLPVLERAERTRVVWRDDDHDGDDNTATRDRAVEDLFGGPS